MPEVEDVESNSEFKAETELIAVAYSLRGSGAFSLSRVVSISKRNTISAYRAAIFRVAKK
jgi:hypothetical protein